MIGVFLSFGTGFLHAFETDHVLAVSNIVSSRNSLRASLKDGAFWGLGHTSTIFLVGLVMMVLKFGLSENIFSYFEAIVGLMLMILAVYRLKKFFGVGESLSSEQPHYLAYFIGLVHGLAGSGSLVLILMTQITKPIEGLMYLILFGLGSTLGMIVGASLMSIPFSKTILSSQSLRGSLVVASSVLCFVFGGMLIGENLI